MVLPLQEGQQGPWRGWAQGTGGQGSRWQDTEPWRQRQRWQGLLGAEKCSWCRAGTALPGLGQLEKAAAAGKRGSGHPGRGCGGAVRRGAAPTGTLQAALSWQLDWLWTGRRWAAASQALHVAALRQTGGPRQAPLAVGGPSSSHPRLGGPLLASRSPTPFPRDSSSPSGSRLTRQRHRRQGSERWGKSAPLGYSFPPKAHPRGGSS